MQAPPLAYSIPEACRIASIGRTKLYEEIGAGRLIVAKVGNKVLVPADRLREWLTRHEVSKVAA